MSHPDFAHIGDPAINLIEECAELIQALTKLQRFGPGVPPYDNSAAVLAEIADVRQRINEWESTMKCFDLMECINIPECTKQGRCIDDTPSPAPSAAPQEADALREDAERLDWIERHVCDVSRLGDSARTLRISWNNGADYAFVGPRYNANWREAIDAARAALTQHQPQQGEQHE